MKQLINYNIYKVNKSIFLFILSFVIIMGLFSTTININSKDYSGIKKYYYVRNNENKIALTFDDGPHPVYTEKILKILEFYDIKATFFVIGENADYHKDILLKVAEKGHEIGNHTYSHIVQKAKNAKEVYDDVIKCKNTIKRITGIDTKLYRPPQGIIANYNEDQLKMFENYNFILWNVDTMDWAHTPCDTIVRNVMSNIKSGDIILMHDFIGGESPTLKSLEIIIPQLLEKGYKFVTVSELIKSK